MDDVHYRTLLLEHTAPPPRARALDAGLVKMGFPHTAPSDHGADPSSNAEPPIAVCMW